MSTLSIGAAAARVGLPAATLRAWERRYGLPSPTRTTGGYRQYTEADLAVLVRMNALQEAGVRPGVAAALLRGESEVDVFKGAVDQLLAAIAGFDSVALHTTLRGIGQLATPLDIFDRLLAPTLAGLTPPRFELAHAHFATESLHAAAFRLIHTHQPAQPRATALLACFEGELHVMPLFRLAFRLMARDVGIVLLGARTPPQALGPVIAQRQPNAVGLSVTVPLAPERAAELLAGYAAACGSTRWAVGGRGASGIRDAIIAAGGSVVRDSAAFESLLAGPIS